MVETFEEFIDRTRRVLPAIEAYTSDGSHGVCFLSPDPRIDKYWHQIELAGTGSIHAPYSYPGVSGVSPYHSILDMWFHLNEQFKKSKFICVNNFFFRSSTAGLEIITEVDIPSQKRYIVLLAH
jgi:hypothetical protein